MLPYNDGLLIPRVSFNHKRQQYNSMPTPSRAL